MHSTTWFSKRLSRLRSRPAWVLILRMTFPPEEAGDVLRDGPGWMGKNSKPTILRCMTGTLQPYPGPTGRERQVSARTAQWRRRRSPPTGD